MPSAHQQTSSSTTWLPTGKSLVLLLVAGALFILHAKYYWLWLEDDAFISFRYADNLIQGHGLVFNLGETVEGYSNLAWVLVAGLALKLGLSAAVVTQTVGVIAGLVALFLSWRVALILYPRAGLAAVLAPFYLALTPMLPRHAVTGLETVPYATILAAGILMASQNPARRFNPIAPLLGMALVLLRPEGIAFALLILVWRGWGRRILSLLPANWQPEVAEQTSHQSRAARGELLVFGVLFAAYFIWRWQYFGALMPNTFHAKMTGDAHGLLDGFNYTLDFLRENGGAVVAGLFLAVLVTARTAAIFWPVLLVIVAQSGFVILAGGDWMHFSRFFVPVLPLLAAGMAAGLGTVLDRSRHQSGGILTARTVLAVVLLIGFMGIYKAERATDRLVMPAVQSGNYLTDGYQEAAQWLRTNTDTEALIATSDIGILGYYSERKIVDMFGLVDPHIARTPGRLHFKSDARYVLDRQPDIIVLVASEPEQYLRIPDARIFAEPEFRRQYMLAHTIQIGFRDEIIQIYSKAPTRSTAP